MSHATALDRLIGVFDPARMRDRVKARAQLNVFSALSDSYSSAGPSGPSRLYRPAARDAAADTLPALRTLRGQSRDLARNHPIAIGAIGTNLNRVVGTGLALQAQPNRDVLGWTADQAQAWKRQVQTEFSIWADSTDCDITAHGTFYDLQELVLRSVLESGDAFSILPDAQQASPAQPYRLRVQLLEADRIGNPGGGQDTATVAGGIQFDADGRPLRCHVYHRHPGAIMAPGHKAFDGAWWEFTGATGRRRVLHHFRKLRPGQPRGVPYLAPIIDCIKQLGRYTEAEINAAVVSSMFTVFITNDAASPAPVFAGDQSSGPPGDAIEMGSGAVVGLAPKEKVEFANPTRPNTAFEPFVAAIVQQIAVALGLPYELLMKRFDSSYSASRAALLDAWMYLRGVRTWLSRSFCQPVYETWLAEAVSSGRINAPGFFRNPLLRWAYTRASWIGDSQGSLDPKNEVAAYRDAIDANLMTHERAEWELFGTDWSETTPQKVAERRVIEAGGLTPAPKPGAAAPGTQPAAAPAPAAPPPNEQTES